MPTVRVRPLTAAEAPTGDKPAWMDLRDFHPFSAKGFTLGLVRER
ncbi:MULTISPECIES: hypothetical protein [unclassified Streptomyces]|nr:MULTISPECIES: hypothetical protein [unclassified Streptomyces]